MNTETEKKKRLKTLFFFFDNVSKQKSIKTNRPPQPLDPRSETKMHRSPPDAGVVQPISYFHFYFVFFFFFPAKTISNSFLYYHDTTRSVIIMFSFHNNNVPPPQCFSFQCLGIFVGIFVCVSIVWLILIIFYFFCMNVEIPANFNHFYSRWECSNKKMMMMLRRNDWQTGKKFFSSGLLFSSPHPTHPLKMEILSRSHSI